MRQRSRLLRWLILFLPPLLLAILEWWHPVNFSDHVFASLYPQKEWWLGLHLLQLPLLALVATGFYFLLEGIHNRAATVCRISAWFFLVYYAAFDAVAGIGLGNILRNAQYFGPDEQGTIARLAQSYFNDSYLGGVHSWLSEFSSLTWLVTAWSAMWALYLAGCHPFALFFLFLSGIFLWYSHAYPYGTIAFICLLLAYLGVECWPRRRLRV